MGYSHTLAVRRRADSVSVAPSSSFHTRAMHEGGTWSVHKGRTNGPLPTKVVVKLPTSPAACGDRCEEDVAAAATEVEAEVEALNFTRAVAQRGGLGGVVEVAATFTSSVDKVGRLGRAKGRGPREDDPVLVQHFVPGPVRTLLDLRTAGHHHHHHHHHDGDAACLLELCRQSLRQSGGRRVIAAVKGVRQQGSGRDVTYLLTSVTVHSRGGDFGRRDGGASAVSDLELRLLPSGRTLPSAPPLPPPRSQGRHGDLCYVTRNADHVSKNSDVTNNNGVTNTSDVTNNNDVTNSSGPTTNSDITNNNEQSLDTVDYSWTRSTCPRGEGSDSAAAAANGEQLLTAVLPQLTWPQIVQLVLNSAHGGPPPPYSPCDPAVTATATRNAGR